MSKVDDYLPQLPPELKKQFNQNDDATQPAPPPTVVSGFVAASMSTPAQLPFPGARVGMRVQTCVGFKSSNNGLTDFSADFEATISVANQIRQIGTAAGLPDNGNFIIILST